MKTTLPGEIWTCTSTGRGSMPSKATVDTRVTLPESPSIRRAQLQPRGAGKGGRTARLPAPRRQRTRNAGNGVWAFQMAKAIPEAGPEGRSEEGVEAEVARRTEELRAALARSEALLQDLDHRAKNNLQTLASLAILKARRVKDPVARGALTNMAERIAALSTAHRLVYTEGGATWFDLRELVTDLARDLAVAVKPGDVELALAVAPIALTGDKATPLGLLVNELLGNALRHAFPHGGGRLAVSAEVDGDLRIVVEDDGVGPAAHRSAEEGFGKNLIDMLARQLRGTIAWEDAAPGTRAVLVVPLADGDLKAAPPA
jgi:two-component sensor histidine kinase